MQNKAGDKPSAPIPSILYVDDEPGCREVIKRLFESHPEFRLQTVETNTEALRIMRSESVDVLIQDLHRPFGGGEDLCHAMRADAKLRRIPIIIHSGRSPKLSHLWQGYVKKPFNHRVLFSLLRNILAEYPPRR